MKNNEHHGEQGRKLPWAHYKLIVEETDKEGNLKSMITLRLYDNTRKKLGLPRGDAGVWFGILGALSGFALAWGLGH